MEASVNIKDIIEKLTNQKAPDNLNINVSLMDIFENCLNRYEKEDFVKENLRKMFNENSDIDFKQNFINNDVMEHYDYNNIIELINKKYLLEWCIYYFDLKDILYCYCDINSRSKLIYDLQEFGLQKNELK